MRHPTSEYMYCENGEQMKQLQEEETESQNFEIEELRPKCSLVLEASFRLV